MLEIDTLDAVDRFLEGVAWVAGFVVPICIIGLISEVVGVVQQVPVQRGIDAHTVRLWGTFDELDKGSKFHDDKHFVSYSYQDKAYDTPLRGLPGNPDLGARVCVEIDATKPQNMRPCDTRGGLGDSLAGLGWGGGILAICLLVIWSRFEWAFPGFSFSFRGEKRLPPNRPPRRKPTRRDRKRARKAQSEAEDELYRW